MVTEAEALNVWLILTMWRVPIATMIQSRIFTTLNKWLRIVRRTQDIDPTNSEQDVFARRPILFCLSLILLVISNCGSTHAQDNRELEWKVAVCKYMARELPTTLPKSCVHRDRMLTVENGSLRTVQVNLPCGTAFYCTWVCITKKREGPKFKVKHGPWTLCEACLGNEPVPNVCYGDKRFQPRNGTTALVWWERP